MRSPFLFQYLGNLLFGDFTEADAAGFGYAFAIGRTGLVAVVDGANRGKLLCSAICRIMFRFSGGDTPSAVTGLRPGDRSFTILSETI
ncbi:MAG: hypothetical protein Q8O28_03875 [Smithellaceae bacterium]|nr:hypothetical protein [Smithellaceae bacterium]